VVIRTEGKEKLKMTLTCLLRVFGESLASSEEIRCEEKVMCVCVLTRAHVGALHGGKG